MTDHPVMEETKRQFEMMAGATPDDHQVADLLLQGFVLSAPSRRIAKIQQLDSQVGELNTVSVRQRAQMHSLRRKLVGMHDRLLRSGR
jgi:hypothetical protein